MQGRVTGLAIRDTSMSGRWKSLQPPSDHGGNEGDRHSSDSLENLMLQGIAEESLVQLNVGGRKFDTTEATLGSRGPNFLTSLLTSQLPSTRDHNGRLFIDRSSALFEVLLEYLRTHVLRIPSNILPDVCDLPPHSTSLFQTSSPPLSTPSHLLGLR